MRFSPEKTRRGALPGKNGRSPSRRRYARPPAPPLAQPRKESRLSKWGQRIFYLMVLFLAAVTVMAALYFNEQREAVAPDQETSTPAD